MLWRKGQERHARDERRRMAQMFGSTRDALQHVVVPLWAGRKAGRAKTPWYLEGEGRKAGPGLDALKRDFPANVATGTEFVH